MGGRRNKKREKGTSNSAPPEIATIKSLLWRGVTFLGTSVSAAEPVGMPYRLNGTEVMKYAVPQTIRSQHQGKLCWV
jgi:hypothetical protein